MGRSRHRLALIAFTALASVTSTSVCQSPAAAPAVPPAPAPAKAVPTAPAVDKPAAADLPSADELVKRHVTAIGGEAAFLAVKSITTTSTVDMTTAGIKGTMVTQMAEPNRFVSSMNLGSIGVVRQGFDGKIAWSTDPMQGPRILAGKELDHVKRESDFRRDLSLLKDYDNVTVVGKTTFGGHDAFEVLAKGAPGEMTLFFDATSNLLCGMKTSVESGLGSMPVETVISEYRAFDGPGGPIKLPARSEMAMMSQNQKMVISVDRVEFAPIDEATFALPTEIAALASAPQPKPETKPETKPAVAPAVAPQQQPTTPATAPPTAPPTKPKS